MIVSQDTMDGYSTSLHRLVFLISMVLQAQGCTNVCPLGVANKSIILDNQLSASSSFRSEYYLSAKYGRLHGSRAWCPSSQDADDWLQVDMGNIYLLCGIGTQGKKYGINEWTTNYTISTSIDGIKWKEYTEKGILKNFNGNTNETAVASQNFSSNIWASHIRFYPKAYKRWPCLRVEIYVEIYAPFISVKPENQTIVAGSHLLLNCLSKVSPMARVTWKLNGKETVFGKVLQNGSLLFELVENNKHFEGTYRCIATNKAGYDISESVVIIHEKPRIFNLLPAYKTALLGSTVVFACHVFGDPLPIITWTKDSSTRIPSGAVHDQGHVLVLRNVTVHSQGIYKCKAANYLDKATSLTNLTIIDRPTIDTLLTRKMVQANPHQVVNIGCYGKSTLHLTYTWTKNKAALTGYQINSTVQVFGNILVVTPVAATDYGIYTCHVKNAVDTAVFGIELSSFHDKQRNTNKGTAGKNVMLDQENNNERLAIILPIVLVLLLSIVVNIRLFYRLYRINKSNNLSVPIGMNILREDTQTAWDNLIAEDHGNSGPFVNAEMVGHSDH